MFLTPLAISSLFLGTLHGSGQLGEGKKKKGIPEDRGGCTLVPRLSVIFQDVSSHFHLKVV